MATVQGEDWVSATVRYEGLSRERGGRNTGWVGYRHGASSTDSPNGCRADNERCEHRGGSVQGTCPSVAPGPFFREGGDATRQGGGRSHLGPDAENRRVPDSALGYCRLARHPDPVVARDDRLGAADQNHLVRTGLLSAGTGRPGRQGLHSVQVPHDDRRRGKTRRPCLGDEG